MVDFYTPERALCNIKELELAWNISQNPNNNNVYSRYVQNPKKNKQYKIMDMGGYCVMNDITPSMLKVAIKHIKEVSALVNGDDTKANNKVVVMSEEDYKTYDMFKKMKAFNEQQGK